MRLATLGERPPRWGGQQRRCPVARPLPPCSRPRRGGSDGKSRNSPQALKKRREHGEEALALHLSLVGAFERVPRVLL
jgi:hypothetical protein